MIRNYFKIAIRNLTKYRIYSFINIAGLSVGIACAILIALLLRTEMRYDRFHEDHERIYRAFQRQEHSGGNLFTDNLPGPLAAHLKEKYAGIEETTRFIYGGGRSLKYGDKVFNETGICMTDQSFFDIFSFELTRGDRPSLLSEPNSIVITESVAEKYFGDEDPIGKVMTLENLFDVAVTGVIKDMPPNTSFSRLEILLPFKWTQELYGNPFDRWGNNWPRTYVKLAEGADPAAIVSQISNVLVENGQTTSFLSLQPLRDANLYQLNGEMGFIRYLAVFAAIGVFILLVAGMNFVNLATARAQKRAREVGLRKVCGAAKADLMLQFFGESVLISMIALTGAVVLAQILLPVLNSLAGRRIATDIFSDAPLMTASFAIALVTGLLSGIYPAIYLASFHPARVLKGVLSAGGGSRFRNALVVSQFAISIALIIGTTIILRQLDFMQRKDLGYNPNGLVNIYLTADAGRRLDALKEEIDRGPAVLGSTAVSTLPLSSGNSSSRYDWEGREENNHPLINRVVADHRYIETMGMKMAAGRSFIENDAIVNSQSTPGFIFNETAIRQMRIEDPVGKWFDAQVVRGTIVGVVKDFNFETLADEVEPMMLCVASRGISYLVVRIDTERTGDALAHIESAWNQVNPGLPFVSTFMDSDIERLYGQDMRFAKIFGYAAVLAVFIACLGLFGLVSYMAERRGREMSIRKVLGAPVSGIVLLFTRDIARSVLYANLIAWPAAWFFMNKWLGNYAYRTGIDPSIFVLAGLAALAIALLTVGFQALRTARANPVDAIRNE